ncbi:hypothetical protein ACFX12_033587 [Malus domestica]
MLNPFSHSRRHPQHNLSKYSALFPPIIPQQISHTKNKRQGEREQSVGTSNLELTVWDLCLVAYLALLSSTHPQLLSRS